MIVVALFLILAGSFTGAAALWFQGASFWGIALGYVGGGWAGFLGGMALAMALRGLAGLFPARPAPAASDSPRRAAPSTPLASTAPAAN